MERRLYFVAMTVKEFIDELKAYPQDMRINVAGFDTPWLDMATVTYCDVEKSQLTGRVEFDTSRTERVLCIFGDDEREVIYINGHENHQPHYIVYDHDGITRS